MIKLSAILISDVDKGWKQILRSLMQPPGYVTCGIHEGSGSTNGVTHVMKAYYNEFGSPPSVGGRRVPERPFLRTTVDEHQEEYFADLKQMGDIVLLGKGSLKDALSIIGFKAVGHIRDTILRPMDPPNAEFTIRKKGFDFPLIETDAMYNVVSFKVTQ